MHNLQDILNAITRLTFYIETNYPALYRTLNENPITIPSENHPDVNITIMNDYLDSLKQLLKHHIKTHKN